MNSQVRDRAALVEPIMEIELVNEMSRIADEVYVDRAVVDLRPPAGGGVADDGARAASGCRRAGASP